LAYSVVLSVACSTVNVCLPSAILVEPSVVTGMVGPTVKVRFWTLAAVAAAFVKVIANGVVVATYWIGASLLPNVTWKLKVGAASVDAADTVALLKPAVCSALCITWAEPAGLLSSKLIEAVVTVPTFNSYVPVIAADPVAIGVAPPSM
jgi:hypothetical protein